MSHIQIHSSKLNEWCLLVLKNIEEIRAAEKEILINNTILWHKKWFGWFKKQPLTREQAIKKLKNAGSMFPPWYDACDKHFLTERLCEKLMAMCLVSHTYVTLTAEDAEALYKLTDKVQDIEYIFGLKDPYRNAV